ncbi:MAG: hypothetical protein CVV23_04805 [Ignavibacteriae bacterium HGW-Ignavibacteriae-2]|jgi:hypothetical protein|nr:MAG: hypothetical protein CVV23_04805 [Ignavibacteriae bacterium HGW-Ignavibacteriae-2]
MVKKNKSITRFDYPDKGMFGFYVRVAFGGKIYKPKFFSDKKYKGKARALTIAIEYRDLIEKEIGKIRSDYIVVTTSKAEYVGIRETISKQVKNGKTYTWPVFEITSPQTGRAKVKRSRVSIQKHGREEALKLAIKKRKLFEKEIYGTTSNFDNAAKKLKRRANLSKKKPK